MQHINDFLSGIGCLLQNLATELRDEEAGPPGIAGDGTASSRPRCDYDLVTRIIRCPAGRPAKLSKTFMNLFVRLIHAPDHIVHYLDTLEEDCCCRQLPIWQDESDLELSSRRCVACRLSKVLKEHGFPYRVRYSEVRHAFELIYCPSVAGSIDDATCGNGNKIATPPPETATFAPDTNGLLRFLAEMLHKNAVVRFCEECGKLLRILMSRQDGKTIPES